MKDPIFQKSIKEEDDSDSGNESEDEVNDIKEEVDKIKNTDKCIKLILRRVYNGSTRLNRIFIKKLFKNEGDYIFELKDGEVKIPSHLAIELFPFIKTKLTNTMFNQDDKFRSKIDISRWSAKLAIIIMYFDRALVKNHFIQIYQNIPIDIYLDAGFMLDFLGVSDLGMILQLISSKFHTIKFSKWKDDALTLLKHPINNQLKSCKMYGGLLVEECFPNLCLCSHKKHTSCNKDDIKALEPNMKQFLFEQLYHLFCYTNIKRDDVPVEDPIDRFLDKVLELTINPIVKQVIIYIKTGKGDVCLQMYDGYIYLNEIVADLLSIDVDEMQNTTKDVLVLSIIFELLYDTPVDDHDLDDFFVIDTFVDAYTLSEKKGWKVAKGNIKKILMVKILTKYYGISNTIQIMNKICKENYVLYLELLDRFRGQLPTIKKVPCLNCDTTHSDDDFIVDIDINALETEVQNEILCTLTEHLCA